MKQVSVLAICGIAGPCLLITLLSCNRELSSGKNLSLSETAILNEPITIIADCSGSWDRIEGGVRSWNLSVNSAGQAALTIYDSPNWTTTKFEISEEQMLSLRQELVKQRFFELNKDSYGDLVFDGYERTLIIAIGTSTKQVTIHYLMNAAANNNKDVLREPLRIIRIQQIIREWIDHPRAADMRPVDNEIIKMLDRPETMTRKGGVD